MSLQRTPEAGDILEAVSRIEPYIHHTPVMQSAQINDMAGLELYFKCENFQKAGAFKSRGAMNAILSGDKESLKNGVATHSSGNHAQALARAAKIHGVPAYIVMPRTAPAVKVAAVEGYGALITFCEPTLEARESTLRDVIRQTGAMEIHPYNNYDVIAGQATCCYELLQQVPGLDYVLCPVGGGGLLSGTLLCTQYFSSDTRVIACEPEGANDAWKSFRSGQFIPSSKPNTIADGLLTSLGSITYPIMMKYAADVITVDDHQILQAMKLVLERMKIVIEPSSAVPVAVALYNKDLFKDKKVGIIISGGNVDIEKVLCGAR